MRPPYKKRHEYPDQQRRQNRSELMDNSPVPPVPFRSPPTAPRHTPSPGDKHLSIHTVIEPRHRYPSNTIDTNAIIHRAVSPSVHLQGPSRPGSAQSVSDLASTITLDSPAGELPASIAHQRSRSSEQNGQHNQVAFNETTPGPLVNLGYLAFESTTNAEQKLRQQEKKAPPPIRPDSSSRPPTLLNANYVLATASTTTRPSGRHSHSVLDLEIPLPPGTHAEPPGPSLKELRDRKPSPRHVHRDEASTYENAAIPSSSNHALPPPTPVKQLVILPEKRNRPDTLPIRRRVSLSPNDRESGICTADSTQLRSLPSSGNRQPAVSNAYDHLSPRSTRDGVSSSSAGSSSSASNGRSHRVAPQPSANHGDELPRSKAPERPPSATKPPPMNCGPYPKVPPIPKQYRLSSVIPQPKPDSG
ncbi:hypothetical protein AAVH_02356 [Aphelenchoides avenae]|nr:hypothetical protein AAVH_02356 [Aphelenchus avenae]